MRVSEQSETRFLFRNFGTFPQFDLPRGRRLVAFAPPEVLFGGCHRAAVEPLLGLAATSPASRVACRCDGSGAASHHTSQKSGGPVTGFIAMSRAGILN